jgi:F0F1-type ATP synthase assembly protein I
MAGENRTNWGQGLAMGFETAVGVALGYFAGNWLDKRFGWAPWGMLVGMMLGLVGGAYLLIKEMNRMDQKDRESKDRPS